MRYEHGLPVAVYPDSQRVMDKTIRDVSDRAQVAVCRDLQQNIQALCRPYQNPDAQYADFWSVAPGYSLLPKERMVLIQTQVRIFTRIYDLVNRMFGSPLQGCGIRIDETIPTYFRFDAMSLRAPENSVINAEVGTVPVGEGEVTAMRHTYDRTFANRLLKQFPGSGESMAKILAESFPGARIRIVLPPKRLGYLGDYQFLADFCRRIRGIDVEVEEPGSLSIQRGCLMGTHGKIDVVYRGFQLSDLEHPSAFEDAEAVLVGASRGSVCIYPQITHWDRKEILGRLFQQEVQTEIKRLLGESGLESLSGMFPWTYVCDNGARPFMAGALGSWDFFASVVAKKSGFILKPSNGREARGLIFSDKVSNGQWQAYLKEALGNCHPDYILQRDYDRYLERFIAAYFDREQDTLLEVGGFRDRLCVNTFVSGRRKGQQREAVIGDIDHTLRRNTRLIHTSSDAVHLPVYVI